MSIFLLKFLFKRENNYDIKDFNNHIIMLIISYIIDKPN